MEPRSEPHGVEECFSRALRKAKVAMQAHPEEALMLVVAAAAFVRLTPRRWVDVSSIHRFGSFDGAGIADAWLRQGVRACHETWTRRAKLIDVLEHTDIL